MQPSLDGLEVAGSGRSSRGLRVLGQRELTEQFDASFDGGVLALQHLYLAAEGDGEVVPKARTKYRRRTRVET